MASTLTSKSTSCDSTKMSAPPLSVIILTIISLLIAIPMIALSVVNFGMLSIWLNSTVVILVLVYHLVFLTVILIHRKSFSSANTPIFEQTDKVAEDEGLDYLDEMPCSKPPSIAFNKWNLVALIFLLIANLIAFSVMVNVTTLGAMRGTLPAERLGSHEWNIKIQVAQTAVLGCQLLTIGTLLGITAWGQRRIVLEEEDRSQEQYII